MVEVEEEESHQEKGEEERSVVEAEVAAVVELSRVSTGPRTR